MKTCALERAKKNLVNRYEGYVYDKRKQLNYVLMNYSALENQNKRRTNNNGNKKKVMLKSRDKVN